MESERKGRKDGESERGVVYRCKVGKRGEKKERASFTMKSERRTCTQNHLNHQKLSNTTLIQ